MSKVAVKVPMLGLGEVSVNVGLVVEEMSLPVESNSIRYNAPEGTWPAKSLFAGSVSPSTPPVIALTVKVGFKSLVIIGMGVVAAGGIKVLLPSNNLVGSNSMVPNA